MSVDVLIIGAGPSGLTAANILARHNINFRIVDSADGPTHQSRSTLVHIRTLELLDKLRLTRPLLEQGVRITHVNIMDHGKSIADIPLSTAEVQATTPYPYAFSIEQSKTQRILLDGLEQTERQVEWHTHFVRLSQSSESITVVLRHADGSEETLETRWLIGADGTNSAVRHALQIPFGGSAAEQILFLADVDIAAPPPPNRLTLSIAGGGTVGILPLDDQQRHRLFGTLSEKFAEKMRAGESQTMLLQDVQEWFDTYFLLNTRLTAVHSTSLYHWHRRIASSFRSGHCFLVGDAAHAHSPSGGQGMNLGIGDAFNLAWKLALVVAGEARLDLLDSYELERHPVAKTLLQRTTRGFEAEADQNLWQRYVYPSLIPILARVPAARRSMFWLLSQMWISYADSPAVADSVQTAPGPHAGERAPYTTLEPLAGKQKNLYDLLIGLDHHILLFEGKHGASNLKQLEQGIKALLKGYQVAISVHVIGRAHQAAHDHYIAQTPMVYFVRPDGHIGYRGTPDNLEALRYYLDRLYRH